VQQGRPDKKVYTVADAGRTELARWIAEPLTGRGSSVTDNRTKLGAVQNRLEHTINNLGVFQENISSAESRIRDVDVAAEMVNQTKLQILSQSGTAMLAQANQGAQGVLSLLR